MVFDVYRPVMETLTHPVRGLRKYWPIFLPLGIGSMVGFLGLAKAIAAAYALSAAATVWLFIGLIAGTFPALWREAGEGGPQSRRVGELRCLCAGGIHDPILYSARPPCDGDAEFLVV